MDMPSKKMPEKCDIAKKAKRGTFLELAERKLFIEFHILRLQIALRRSISLI